MSVTRFEYITDNPFRLCGIGSAASLGQLRQKVNALEMAAKVGLPHDIGLEALFGSEDAQRCASIVKALANDSKRLALYRIFWPLAYAHPPVPNGTVADIEAQQQTTELFDTAYDTQLRFLTLWYTFLAAPDAQILGEALGAFIDLYDDTAADGLFIEALESDREADAQNVLYAAQADAAGYLLSNACHVAAGFWQAGKTMEALALLQVVRDIDLTNIKEDATDRALLEFSSIGEREKERLEKLRADYPGWTPERGRSDFIPAEPLRTLAHCLEGCVPAAALWQEAAQNYATGIGYKIRSWAIDAVNENDDWEAAYNALNLVMDEPAAHVCHDTVCDDLQTLYGIMRSAAVTAATDQEDLPEARRILELLLFDKRAASCHDEVGEDLTHVAKLELQSRQQRVQPQPQRTRYQQRHGAQQQAEQGSRSGAASSAAAAPKAAQQQQQNHSKGAAMPSPAELQHVQNPPTLFTFNGIGTKLYGHTPYPGNSNWYVATQYFCFFFIPLFALARFAVSDASTGGWYFHGQLPLTKTNKNHSTISAVALIALVISWPWLFGAGETIPTDEEPQTTVTAPVTPTETVPTATLQTGSQSLGNAVTSQPVTTEPFLNIDISQLENDQRRERLVAEGEALEREVEEESAQIDQESERIEIVRVMISKSAEALDRQHASVDRYDGAAVDAYNDDLRRHRRGAAAFNQRVSDYNARVSRNNAKVARLREINSALKEMEN